MNPSDAIKNISLQELEEKIQQNHKKIKGTKAITYVFDVFIILVAGLYIFDINFSKWLMAPAAASVLLHSCLASLYERRFLFKQQELYLKSKKNKTH
ncbi:hypothetical protein N9V23_03015 [Flavobacteriales bacterium]|jgi:hypothetical protein|nr:hypothetical protein [Flavobacteriales bacterium]MDB2317706.1 hypothetical protein [Flavobacteriales bacterium]MDB2621959.1 hypothetical protein [Flavobacteriales bacterium]